MRTGIALAVLVGIGCGSEGSTPSTNEPTPAAEPAPAPPQSPVEADRAHDPGEPPASTAMPRAQAVQTAEAFVRAQGYTAAEPMGPLVRESIEAGDEDAIRRGRRGTLEPRSVGARRDGEQWLVLFAYADPTDPGAGRGVRVPAEGDPQVVHQDARLPETRPSRVELVATLRAIGDGAPGCGILHVAVALEYEVVRVVSGEYDGETVMALAGCPELPRARYDEGAGTLDHFEVGATHRLTLAPHAPEVAGGLSIVDVAAHPELHRYWIERVDPTDE